MKIDPCDRAPAVRAAPDKSFVPFELSNFSKLQFEPSTDQAPVKETQEETQAAYAPVRKTPFKEPSLKSVGLDAEYEVILEALKKVNFNKNKAAKVLQIDRKTLYNKIKQYHELKGEPYEPEL